MKAMYSLRLGMKHEINTDHVTFFRNENVQGNALAQFERNLASVIDIDKGSSEGETERLEAVVIAEKLKEALDDLKNEIDPVVFGEFSKLYETVINEWRNKRKPEPAEENPKSS